MRRTNSHELGPGKEQRQGFRVSRVAQRYTGVRVAARAGRRRDAENAAIRGEMAEWKTGEYILLERVPHYWRGDSLPAIRRLLFRFVPNTTTRVNQLRAGEVHVVALVPWDRARDLAGVAGLDVRRTMGNAYEHVTLNERRVTEVEDVDDPKPSSRSAVRPQTKFNAR